VERNISIMLTTAAVVFVLLTLPAVIYFANEEVVKKIAVTSPYARDKALFTLLYQLQFLCADLNHAINFFIYFLSNGR
jgi:gastrin-releasing peptide receptor